MISIIRKENSVLKHRLRATGHAVLYTEVSEETIDHRSAWEELMSDTNTAIHSRQKETQLDRLYLRPLPIFFFFFEKEKIFAGK